MKKGMKIFLGVGCGVLLIGALAIVVGIVALSYVEKCLGESTAKFELEARELGKTTDQQGCVSEGMRRSARVGLIDLNGGMELSAFVDACLETSKPTTNFCDGVPSFWSMKETDWGSGQCRKAGLDPETTGCIHVTKRKHQFCNKPF